MDIDASYGATPLDPDEERYLAHPSLAGKTKSDIDALEQDGLITATTWARRTRADLLDEYTLRTMHRMAFEKVWTWAGAYRSTELSIGIDPSQISVQMNQLLGSLSWRADNGLLDQADIARSHLAFTSIHPFRNGNGRLARIWANLLADQHGLPRPSWGRREEYIAVLRSADEQAVTDHLYPRTDSASRSPSRNNGPAATRKTDSGT